LIGAFKTVSTKRVNQIHNTPGAKLWQRNYYEHIIRSENEITRIRAYIAQNPAKWKFDWENPSVRSPDQETAP
jgi:REP element-mobilizing transposase RayT